MDIKDIEIIFLNAGWVLFVFILIIGFLAIYNKHKYFKLVYLWFAIYAIHSITRQICTFNFKDFRSVSIIIFDVVIFIVASFKFYNNAYNTEILANECWRCDVLAKLLMKGLKKSPEIRRKMGEYRKKYDEDFKKNAVKLIVCEPLDG